MINDILKKSVICISISLALLIVGVVGCSADKKDTTVASSSNSSSSEADKIKAEEKAKKEAEEKAKKEAEEKAKKEAEEKAKAEEEMKSANAKLYKTFVFNMTEEITEMQDSTFEFIKNNPTLFPAKTDQDKQKLAEMVDSSIEYKHLAKNATPYLDKVMTVIGGVVKIEEATQDNITLTYIHIVTENADSFEILYLGTIDAFEDDVITVTGVPVGMNQFPNISGGTTLTAVLIAGDAKKIE